MDIWALSDLCTPWCVHVLVGGRERGLAEFGELARAAGLEVQAAERQASGRFVVECRPT